MQHEAAQILFAILRKYAHKPKRALATMLYYAWIKVVHEPATAMDQPIIDMTEDDVYIHITEFMGALPESYITNELSRLRGFMDLIALNVPKKRPEEEAGAAGVGGGGGGGGGGAGAAIGDGDGDVPGIDQLRQQPPTVDINMLKSYLLVSREYTRVSMLDPKRMFGYRPEMAGVNMGGNELIPFVAERISTPESLMQQRMQRQIANGASSRTRRRRPATQRAAASRPIGEFWGFAAPPAGRF